MHGHLVEGRGADGEEGKGEDVGIVRGERRRALWPRERSRELRLEKSDWVGARMLLERERDMGGALNRLGGRI